MPRTRLDLVKDVLEKLGQLGAGQALEAEDRTTVEAAISAVSANLAARKIAYIPAPNSIPDAWFMPLGDIVAGSLISKYGLVGEDAARVAAMADAGITNIRETKQGELSGARADVEWF